MKKVTRKKAKQPLTKKQKHAEREEFSLAILLSLVPLMVFSLFSQMGLF